MRYKNDSRIGDNPDLRNSLDLGYRVDHGVVSILLSLVVRSKSARLAKVEISDQLPDNHDINAFNDFLLQS